MNNRVYNKGLTVVLIIALSIMTYLGIKLSTKEEIVFKEYERNIENDDNAEKSEVLFVDIDGAVKTPGVYELKEGSRVNDAIIMAGGLNDNAYTKNLNKAKLLNDGEKIYILSIDEIGESETNISSKLININTASKEMLMTISGIGDVYAQRIIDYRNNKSFSSIEEIKNVNGIGEKTFEKMKDLITVD